MKRILFILTLLLFGIGTYAQSSAYTKEIYKDYGTFKLETDDGHIVSLSAFATIEEEQVAIHENEVQSMKSRKSVKISPPKYETEYHYELYLVSKSVFEGDTTSTWIKGLRIYVDGEDVLAEQFPEGYTLSVGTEPTLIYTHHCEDTFCEFEVTWERAIYEPRIRK